MGHHNQPLELLIAGIGEREHGPIGVAFPGAHVHALHDPVRAGSGGHQQAIRVGTVAFDRSREVEGGGILRHIDGLDRTRSGSRHEQHDRENRQPNGGAQEAQATISNTNRPAGETGVTARQY